MFIVYFRGVNVKKTILFTRRDRSMNGEGRRLAGACRPFFIYIKGTGKMKIQLEHEEIKIDLKLQGVETDQAKDIAKKVFKTFLESIHIVNSEGSDIIEQNTIEKNSAEKNRIENSEIHKQNNSDEPAPVAAAEQGPADPEDPADQSVMAAALAAYEAAEAEKKARAASFGLPGSGPAPRTRFMTPPILLDGLAPSTYRRQGGRLYFQTYVICSDCRHKQKHYIERGTPFVNCHQCGKRNAVRPAKLGSFPHVDDFGNFYIGGTFKRADERVFEPQADGGLHSN